eukprot:scaffold24065_cov37-Phaeocystis_antarctica.AAC.1
MELGLDQLHVPRMPREVLHAQHRPPNLGNKNEITSRPVRPYSHLWLSPGTLLGGRAASEPSPGRRLRQCPRRLWLYQEVTLTRCPTHCSCRPARGGQTSLAQKPRSDCTSRAQGEDGEPRHCAVEPQPLPHALVLRDEEQPIAPLVLRERAPIVNAAHATPSAASSARAPPARTACTCRPTRPPSTQPIPGS